MATAIPTKNTEFWIEAGTHNAPTTSVTPTAISKAKPAVVTCVGSTAIVGQVVYVQDTGFPELDGQYFMVGKGSTATSLILQGSDTTGSDGSLDLTAPLVRLFIEGTDVLVIDVSQFSYDAGSTQTVSVATFLDPTASIPGAPSDGTASFAGYTDPSDPGYRALVAAAAAQSVVMMYIRLPPIPGKVGDPGVVVLEGAVNGYTESYDVGQAVSWTSGLGLTRGSKQLWEPVTAA